MGPSPFEKYTVMWDMCNIMQYLLILLMEEFLHHLIGSSSHYLQGFLTSQVVQDFFHQQYHLDNSKSGGIFVQRPSFSKLSETEVSGRGICLHSWHRLCCIASMLGKHGNTLEFLEVPGGWKGSY